MSNPASTTPTETHDQTWGERLQDWFDGDLDAAGSSTIEAHVGACPLCQAQLAELESLDRALAVEFPQMSLDARFDAQLLRRIDAIDEQHRLRSRQRLEREMQANLQTLRRRWKYALAFLVPGIAAGLALTVALLSWVDHSGVTRSFATESAGTLGHGATMYAQLAMTVLVGGGISLGLARWLSMSTD